MKCKIHIHSDHIYKLLAVHQLVRDVYPENYMEYGDWTTPVYYNVDVPSEADYNLIMNLFEDEKIKVHNVYKSH